jgi:hypothetical protein
MDNHILSRLDAKYILCRDLRQGIEGKPKASNKIRLCFQKGILGGFSVAKNQGIKIRSRFQKANDQPFPD